jgi:negative regulator of sigma E activity
MNSNRDPLELELESLRPPDLSADLRARIARAIDAERRGNPAPVHAKWPPRWLAIAALAAAACVVISVSWFVHSRNGSMVMVREHDHHERVDLPTEDVRRSPTLAAYTHAAAQSPEQLDSMLNADAASLLGPPTAGEIRAFGQSLDDLKH